MSAAQKGFSTHIRYELYKVAMAFIPLVCIVAFFFSGYIAIATLAYLLMVSGLLMRSNPAVHYRLMVLAIAIDLVMVLTLQVQRSAIQTAAGEELRWIQLVHVSSSLVAVVGYLPLLIQGIRKLANKSHDKGQSWHKALGIIVFIFRSIGFVTMFSMVR